MTAKLTRIVVTLIGGILALGTITTWAAKAPLSPEALKKEASHIVSGLVVELTSKTQKSEIEKARGTHRDRVFRIKLMVKSVSKGTGVKKGDEIEIVAWQPARRIPPLPGLQGHESIPKKGYTVTVYLQGNKGNAFKPILPNGIVIETKKEAD